MQTEIDLLHYEYNSGLKKHIHSALGRDETNILNFIDGIERIFQIRDKRYLLRNMGGEDVLDSVNLSKKVAQISLNLYLNPHIYKNCEINEYGIKVIDSKITQYPPLNIYPQISSFDVETNIGRFLTSFYLANQIEMLRNYDNRDGSDFRKNEKRSSINVKGENSDLVNQSHNIDAGYKHGMEPVHHQNKGIGSNIGKYDKEYNVTKADSESAENIEDNWRCKACAFRNTYDRFSCMACTEDGLHDHKWRCKKCLSINEKRNSVNVKEENSDLRNPSHNIGDELGMEPTNHKNKGNSSDIEKHDKEYNVINIDYESAENIEDKWRCKACAFRNTYDRYSCMACTEGGPHYHKWKCEKCSSINEKRILINVLNSDPIYQSQNIDPGYKHDMEPDHHKNKGISSNIEKRDKVYNITKADSETAENMENKWQCKACSCLNTYDLCSCMACNNDGPHLSKWKFEKFPFINEKRSSINVQSENNDPRNPSHSIDAGDKHDTEPAHHQNKGNSFNIEKHDKKNNITKIDKESAENIEDKWRCKACTCLNTYDRFSCMACNNDGPHYHKWRCEQCSFINGKIDYFCKACDNRNLNLTWCDSCKFARINKLWDTRCARCTTYPSTNPTTYSPGYTTTCIPPNWTCLNKACNAENYYTNFYCRQCHASKKALFTRNENFLVRIGDKYNFMWQCQSSLCLAFNDCICSRCRLCDVERHPYKYLFESF